MIDQQLTDEVQEWLIQDPDSQTVEALRSLFARAKSDQQALSQLEDAFRSNLNFGTAGLRGKLGPGPNRMNRVTVLRAAAGLGRYLLDQGCYGLSVVIGFDARHNSERFAQDTAEVLSAMGFEAKMFGDVVPTPVLAFAILDQQACAGVMVTASHNPAGDNGYKVYLGDGRQIVSPVDSDIASHIAQVFDVSTLARSQNIITLGQDVVNRYVEATAEIVTNGPVARADIESVRYVYSAMHGVGYRSFSYLMHHAGFGAPDPVPSQQHPDPDFPTLAFPNPEESGALDLAIAYAREQRTDLVIAHDPDADRFAVAVADELHHWRMLRGDEVGVLLGWWLLERSRRMHQPLIGAFATSVVSSTLLQDLADSAGLKFERTLTGFKWVSRVPNLIYGYEEALGYCVDPVHVKDKDGLSAAMLFLEMVAALHSEKQSVLQAIEDIYRQYGTHVTDQLVVKITDVNSVSRLMTHLRESPPTKIGELAVTQVIDLAKGLELPPTDGIIFNLNPMQNLKCARVVVRPSGTEPKVKCYLEVAINGNDVRQAKQDAQAIIEDLKHAMTPLLDLGSS